MLSGSIKLYFWGEAIAVAKTVTKKSGHLFLKKQGTAGQSGVSNLNQDKICGVSE
jgi:hypothetical protein